MWQSLYLLFLWENEMSELEQILSDIRIYSLKTLKIMACLPLAKIG